MASYIGKFTFQLSVKEVTYNFYIRQTIAKSRSKNCPYKVKGKAKRRKISSEWDEHVISEGPGTSTKMAP